jgi:hypothetical protein
MDTTAASEDFAYTLRYPLEAMVADFIAEVRQGGPGTRLTLQFWNDSGAARSGPELSQPTIPGPHWDVGGSRPMPIRTDAGHGVCAPQKRR